VRVDLAARAAAMLILDVAEAARASDLPCRVGLAVAHVPERRLPTWPRRGDHVAMPLIVLCL
jgi:hypothetical protein